MRANPRKNLSHPLPREGGKTRETFYHHAHGTCSNGNMRRDDGGLSIPTCFRARGSDSLSSVGLWWHRDLSWLSLKNGFEPVLYAPIVNDFIRD